MENVGRSDQIATARELGLVGCTVCGRVHPISAQTCVRCGAALRSRNDDSLQYVWAWLIAGIVAYFPANIYPMLKTATLGKSSESTIVGGAVELIQHGSIGVALIVLVASVLIPLSKFAAIIYLALSVRGNAKLSRHRRHQLYEVVEFIGRWSMIDVFVVAILSALVHLGSAANINPGIAAVSFALSVSFTMLAAQSFDSRMIWDASRNNQ